jgi:hypothetical protein
MTKIETIDHFKEILKDANPEDIKDFRRGVCHELCQPQLSFTLFGEDYTVLMEVSIQGKNDPFFERFNNYTY